jgi:hypothetical protein
VIQICGRYVYQLVSGVNKGSNGREIEGQIEGKIEREIEGK